ncbi:uracil-DNA glycosylase family protein [Haliangium sp.]|uniref:uracil-DNA glycosylase family protein n=1 Tax=Haliangium sp. TaxID=2663208 RepID=UPI003D10A8B2
MSHSYDYMVVRDYHGRSAQELLSAPVDAIEGISGADAEHLRQAFGVRTVRDLAACRPFDKARAVAAAAAPSFDPGPPPAWATLFAEAPLAHYQASPRRYRLDYGPVWYRGRLDGTARVLVIGQDPAANEVVAHRIFIGASGQRVQGFLARLGITRSYTMFNTFLYPIYGQYFGDDDEGMKDPILGFRNLMLDRVKAENPLQVVLTFGRAARAAVEHWPGLGDLPVAHMQHPSAKDSVAQLATWNAALDLARPLVEPDDGAAANPAPYGQDFAEGDEADIPAFDLPFGVPSFMGKGSHAWREDDWDEDYRQINWRAP